MSEYTYEDARESLNYLAQYIKEVSAQPEIAVVTGSGLGDIADFAANKIIIDVKNIPNWPNSTAPGHSGKIILGEIAGRNIIMLQGRVHYYEGYSMKAVTFPTRVLGMMGVKFLIATNASGAINKDFKPGEIIAVRDHINFMGANPLVGPDEPRWNSRFPDMSCAYYPGFLDTLKKFGLRTGVYAAFMGPSFETPAEIRMAGLLGADLAGMSTIPEVVAANSMDIKVCVLSCVANMSAGIESDKILTEAEVLMNMKKITPKVADIIIRLIESL